MEDGNDGKIRMPKSECRKKPEARNPKDRSDCVRPFRFEIRISDFFRASTFGFRISASSGGKLKLGLQLHRLSSFSRRFKARIQNLLGFQRPHRPVVVEFAGKHLVGKVAEHPGVLRRGMALDRGIHTGRTFHAACVRHPSARGCVTRTPHGFPFTEDASFADQRREGRRPGPPGKDRLTRPLVPCVVKGA